MAKKRGSSSINIVFDSLDSESNSEVLSKINELVKFIEQKTGKEFSDILSQIKKQELVQKNFLPLSILSVSSKKLGVAEAIVRFLKDSHGLDYKEISKIMHRSEGVVGVMYRTTLKKWPGALNPNTNAADADNASYNKQNYAKETFVPLTIFSSEFTAFESIIIYLKEKESLRFSEIAKLTGRDQRTIWTIYNRIQKEKMGKKTTSGKKITGEKTSSNEETNAKPYTKDHS